MNENIIYEKLGANIKKHRKSRDMTQNDLAKRVGLTRGSIANIESGSQRVLVHQLYIFSKYLETTPGNLLPEYIEEETENIKDIQIQLGGTENHVIPKDEGNKVLSWISEMVGKAAHERT
ncbi:MAG TPA: hypothetical protein DD412_05220 [Holosporales bacterium]|nr:hypothetical protein [Holosporales bacterium]